jgi:hypothetical protein
VLANRLKVVIGSVISEEQSAFIQDRNILDGPLVMSEVLSWLKKDKSKAFVFKVDFNKAFDSINWEFIGAVLEQMCFPSRWRQWIKGIMASARSSVLTNGSPTGEFNCERGVRQGDPLSPFIFILAMEDFASFISAAVREGILTGIMLPNGGPT